MAQLYGFEIKGVKSFRGHDGESLKQGNLYYNGKKVAFWSQDAWGGPDTLIYEDLEKDTLLNTKSALKDAIEKFKESEYCYDTSFLEYINYESFIEALILLKDLEKEFKNYVKRGFCSVCIVTNGLNIRMAATKRSLEKESAVSLFKPFVAESIKGIENNLTGTWMSRFKIHAHYYDSLDDFVIS